MLYLRENPNDPASKNLPLPDIPTLIHRCLKAEKDRNLSDNSRKELRRYLNEFSAYCQSQGISSAEELISSFLKAYADHRCMDDKPALKKAVVWFLRKFGKYLALLQVVNKDPAQNLRHPKFHPSRNLPTFIVSVDQVEAQTGLDFLSEIEDSVEDLIEGKKSECLW
jgi:site-specific recombinase XerD